MLDHTKPYVEKMHFIDAELAGHVGYINLTWNGSVCVGVAFLCLLCACLPILITLELIDPQLFAKTKMGYISLPSDLKAIIGITSYYCVILKMVILHGAIKTIQNSFFSKKQQKSDPFQKNKKNGLKQTKNPYELFFSKLVLFSNLSSIHFLWFPLIARSAIIITSLSVCLGVRRTAKV